MLVENYQIGEKVFEDIIGETFVANTGNETAGYIKFLRDDLANNERIVDIFHDCAEEAIHAKSDGLLKPEAHGEDRGRHYLILDTHLKPLSLHLKQKSILSLIDATSLVETVTTILHRAHQGGEFVGVLSPQAIFLDDKLQRVQIANGFLKFVQELIRLKNERLLAALPYLAPEFLKGKKSHPQSDIYSLGILLYRLLIGRVPRESKTFDDALVPQSSIIPPSLQRLEIPDFFDDIILDAMEPDRDERCPNLDAFLQRLHEAHTSIQAAFTPTSQTFHERPTETQKIEPVAPKADSFPSPVENGSSNQEIPIKHNGRSEFEAIANLQKEKHAETEASETEPADTMMADPIPEDSPPPTEPSSLTEENGLHQDETVIEAATERNGLNQDELVSETETAEEKPEPESDGILETVDEEIPFSSQEDPQVEEKPSLEEPEEPVVYKINSIQQYEFDDKSAVYVPKNGDKEELQTPIDLLVSETQIPEVTAEKPAAPVISQTNYSRTEEIDDDEHFFQETSTQTQIDRSKKHSLRKSPPAFVKIIALAILLLAALYAFDVLPFDFNLSEKFSRLFSAEKTNSITNPVTNNLANKQPQIESSFVTSNRAKTVRPTNTPSRRANIVIKSGDTNGKPAEVNSTNARNRAPVRPGRPVTRPQTTPRPTRPAVATKNSRLEIQVRSGAASLAAAVSLNGSAYGQTDNQGFLVIPNLKHNESYILKINRPGYRMWAKEIALSNPIEQFTIELEKIPPPVTRENRDQNLRQAQKTNNAPSRQTTRSQPPKQPESKPQSPAKTTTATINVELSNPENVSEVFIFVNGTLWNGEDNIAPAQIKLPPGSYEIEVRKDGYQAAPPSFSMDVVGGELRTFSFILLPN